MSRSNSSQASRLSAELENHVPTLLNSTSNRISRGASRLYLKKFGLGINECRMLTLLKTYPGLTANEVCERADLDKAAASRGIRSLEKQGLIVTACENTPKRRLLYLTDKGTAWQVRVADAAKAREEGLLEGFSAKEREVLLRYLQRLLANASIMNDPNKLSASDTAKAPVKRKTRRS